MTRLIRFFVIVCISLLPVQLLAQQGSAATTDDVEEVQDAPAFEERELLEWMGALYRQEAAVLDAAAEGDRERQERLLDEAMASLAELVQIEGTTADKRFRELYRTIVSEYELYYGVSDTLELPLGSIFDVHEDMFAELNDRPQLETVKLPELAPMKTTIPMEVNRLVEQSITYLLKHPEKTVDLWRPRADTYFPMIEQVLREEGLPDEMKYLAMIESGLNPNARSWARANGMWQFISSTGSAYGLSVNRWVDERLDPEKATRAAARHLKDLYKMFGGDWHLAMAGYNCSPARIKRAIRRAEARHGRTATFWDIYQDIPRETRNYVPMFIATALVISNQDKFNLRSVERGPRYEYEVVGVEHVMDLRAAAEMAGTDVSTLKALNPEIRTQSTPPLNGAYPLRVPVGTGDRFVTQYASWAKSRPATPMTHSVKRGESLGLIARRYGVSVSSIQSTNGMRGTTIHPGQQLAIPSTSYSSETAPEITLSEPIRVSYGGTSIAPVAISGLKGPSARSGGTLQDLASHTKSEAEAATRPAARPASTSSASASAGGERVRYQVRRGDSLGKIARRYGVSVSDLRRWNNIRGSRIYAGQRITVYTKGGAAASSTYRVRKGDSLYTIARRHGVSISQLKSWNNLRSNVIRPGQRLKVQG